MPPSWRDFANLAGRPRPVGMLPGDPLARLGIRADQLADAEGPVRFHRKARYLNGARSVVSHCVDDVTEALPGCLDAMDRYGIKATLFIDTQREPLLSRLWPRLRQAIADGHEIGSHSRRHPCRVPESFLFCLGHFTKDEIEGSRDDILANSGQPHVWSWAYPCGNCADREFVQRKIARAGYLVARAYPDEFAGRHAVPDLQGYDPNPYAARYTQVVQKGYAKRGPDGREVAISGRTDVAAVNAKFDEVSEAGGIYSFLSHPQMLEDGPDGFYERHLAHVGGRDDVWYVPMGPLYAYKTLSEQTAVRPLRRAGAGASLRGVQPARPENLRWQHHPRVRCAGAGDRDGGREGAAGAGRRAGHQLARRICPAHGPEPPGDGPPERDPGIPVTGASP